MAERGFFRRLALVNLVRNRQFYGPYLFACGGAAAMFYILCFLTWNDLIDTMPGRDILQVILYLGCIVVAIFAGVILLYANSFVMKRRQRELGLYNVLGLDKRHIARVMVWETLMTGSVILLGGLALGVLLSKLIMLLLLKLVHFPVQMGFSVSLAALGFTAILFCALLLLALGGNLVRLGRSKPIELLHSEQVGEREPKTKWFMTILGVFSLGIGYAISIVVENPVQALTLFFVAVMLVMLGTYCLFTAGSIALLKLLRRNGGFYYQTKHFTAVSGLLYRMKQNAVGLSNICILATMVLVTLSTTVSLYLASEDIMKKMYPAEVETTLYLQPGEKPDSAALRTVVESAAAKSGRQVTLLQDYTTINFPLLQTTEGYEWVEEESQLWEKGLLYFTCLTADDYGRLTGQSVTLESDELLVYSKKQTLPQSLLLGDDTWQVKEQLAQWPLRSPRSDPLSEECFLVLPDRSALEALNAQQQAVYQDRGDSLIYHLFLDVDGTDEEKERCAEAVQDAVFAAVATQGLDSRPHTQCRAGVAYDYYSMYGGFLFLGLFLGLLFLMTTVLIIYYKQISEGYEDRRRFAIMQQVGMSRAEVRASIGSQILLVFFLPLGMAGLHILAAFPMITRLLRLFSLTNVGLFALCTVGTLLCFCLLYGGIYGLTAGSYYKIVRSDRL